MIINLKDDALDHLLSDIETNNFVTDGCACGDYAYQLTDNMWLYVYRSCRKSGNTPDEKLWHLHSIEFYTKIHYQYEKYTNRDETYLEYITPDGKKIENVKLDKVQEKLIIDKLKEVTKNYWGNEYRNED